MKKNKILVITIIIFLMLAIASGVVAYLYMATDIFKSSKELFSEYISQEIEIFQKMTNFETAEIYENLKNENKYEANTKIKVNYSEGGEISNPFNQLSGKLDVQKDSEQNYFYANGRLIFKEEEIVEEQTVLNDKEYLQTEIIKNDGQYGIRFTEAILQFVTVENDENLPTIATEIGVDEKLIETIINVIDGEEQIISKEKIDEIKNKYLNIIKTEMLNGVFERQKNAVITYNNATTKTNAYTVSLSSEQVKNIILQILNNIKEDEKISEKITNNIDQEIEKINTETEISTLKITVYELDKKTIRTVVEIGQHKIIIENREQNEEINTIVNYTNLNDTKVNEYKFEIVKINSEKQEKIQITGTVIQENEEQTISLLSETGIVDNGINGYLEISNKQGITNKSIVLENEIKIGNDFEKIQKLEKGNYIPLSKMTDQSKRKQLIDLIKQIVPENIKQKIELLKEKLNINAENNLQEKPAEQLSQADINKFNSQFEFYTGNEVSNENVKTLLEIVKNNLKSYEIVESTPQENIANVENNKINIKLNIEKDTANEEAIKQISEKIKQDKKYEVIISYKEKDGLIDYITIIEK